MVLHQILKLLNQEGAAQILGSTDEECCEAANWTTCCEGLRKGIPILLSQLTFSAWKNQRLRVIQIRYMQQRICLRLGPPFILMGFTPNTCRLVIPFIPIYNIYLYVYIIYIYSLNKCKLVREEDWCPRSWHLWTYCSVEMLGISAVPFLPLTVQSNPMPGCLAQTADGFLPCSLQDKKRTVTWSWPCMRRYWWVSQDFGGFSWGGLWNV